MRPALAHGAPRAMTQTARLPRLRAALLRPLASADAVLDRLAGSEANPLYQSGAIVVLAFLLMLASGIVLLFFYRVAEPYESIERIQAQLFLGRWLRALHRYAADVAVIAAFAHVLRIFLQGRTWGPRALAWCSGLVLLLLLFVSGWTGYVMVWDAHALLLAAEGARLLDLLPIFAEPLARAFAGERALPSAFFFLNLFAHVAVPVGMAGLLLLHVARIARPKLLPPRGLALALTAALLALSLAVPAPLAPRAEPLALLPELPLDVFYAFWLPLSRALSPREAWALLLGLAALAASAPWWTRPRAALRAAPSQVDPQLCTGCEQCALDCPFEAIEMRALENGRAPLAAHIDPARCVSCGICAGSCAPMAVGPPGRTGRDQLAAARAFLAARTRGAPDVVLIGCQHGAATAGASDAAEFPMACAGNLHSSVVEWFVRAGVGGVLIASCPARDCRGREGPRWLGERLYREREAELKPRVDRRRVRVIEVARGDAALLRAELARFRAEIRALGGDGAERDPQLDEVCEPAVASEGSA